MFCFCWPTKLRPNKWSLVSHTYCFNFGQLFLHPSQKQNGATTLRWGIGGSLNLIADPRGHGWIGWSLFSHRVSLRLSVRLFVRSSIPKTKLSYNVKEGAWWIIESARLVPLLCLNRLSIDIHVRRIWKAPSGLVTCVKTRQQDHFFITIFSTKQQGHIVLVVVEFWGRVKCIGEKKQDYPDLESRASQKPNYKSPEVSQNGFSWWHLVCRLRMPKKILNDFFPRMCERNQMSKNFMASSISWSFKGSWKSA